MEEGCCLVVWFVVVVGASKVICVLLVFSLHFLFLIARSLVLQSRLVLWTRDRRIVVAVRAAILVSICVSALLLFFSFLVLILVLCSVCVGLGFGPGPTSSLVLCLWSLVFSLHCLASCASLFLFFTVHACPCCGACFCRSIG